MSIYNLTWARRNQNNVSSVLFCRLSLTRFLLGQKTKEKKNIRSSDNELILT